MAGGRSGFGTLASVLLCVVAVAASCTGERPQLADARATTSSSSSSTSTTEADAAGVDIATARDDEIAIYPDEEATEPSRALEAADAVTAPDQTPIVFLVKARGDERLEVHLPVAPSGSTGWVAVDEVELTSTTYRVVVGLSGHRLRVFDGDQLLLDQAIDVGRRDRPEPGVYYLKELLEPSDTDGPYGTFAYGLSGFSNELERFNDGEGVIGIHGTDQPELLGRDVAIGSIHLTNEAITRLAEDIGLPLGTPVEVRA